MASRLSPLARVASAFAALMISGQMPEWKFFRDREGNTYYLDRAGSIRVIDADRRHDLIASVRGIDYYLNCGETLIKDHHPGRGLAVLKAILALEADNQRIKDAQVKARQLVDFLKKNHGERFDSIDEEATPYLVRREGFVEAIDDRMRYSFRSSADLAIIRKRIRKGNNYRYVGVLFGVGDGGGRYDALVAVDSEELSVPVGSIGSAEERWRNHIGPERIARSKIDESEQRIVYLFTGGDGEMFAGYEGVVVNGRMTYCVRVITSAVLFNEKGALLRDIVSGFRAVASSQGR